MFDGYLLLNQLLDYYSIFRTLSYSPLFTSIRYGRIIEIKGHSDMNYLDFPEILIALGVVAIAGLVFHNWWLERHHLPHS